MTRIVAGVARGRRLRVPAGTTTRPTSDRVREALFSSLESLLGGFDGLRVLDLYAGSGALGLEALSRGAANVTLADADAQAVRTIRHNVASVGLPGATIIQERAERMLSRPVRGLERERAEPTPEQRSGASDRPGERVRPGDDLHGMVRGQDPRYDLVLADPPYAHDPDELAAVLAGLTSGWLAEDAVVVVERARRSGPVRWPDGLNGLRERAYGETVLWYGRAV